MNKPLAVFRGRTLLANAAAQLSGLCTEVVVSANDNAVVESARSAGLPVVHDSVDGAGPLAGILAGLRYAGDAGALFVPCDTPLLDDSHLALLLQAARRPSTKRRGSLPDVVVAEHRGGLEPLVGWYGPHCKGPIEAALRRGERKVLAIYPELLVVRLWYDVDPRVFANVNTPEDLAELEHEALAGDGGHL